MDHSDMLIHIKKNSILYQVMYSDGYKRVSLRSTSKKKLFILIEYEDRKTFELFYNERSNNLESDLEHFNNFIKV